MSTDITQADSVESAAERSAVYRVLADAASYSRAQTSPFGIAGADYNDAFDPAISKGACSLREHAHTNEDQSSVFEELMRFYEFFGLKRGEKAEMPDHLSVELEFMHFLTHLEDQAADQPESLASVRLAQFDFLTRHLSKLANGLHSSLKSQNPQCLNFVETVYDFINSEIALAKYRAEA